MKLPAYKMRMVRPAGGQQKGSTTCTLYAADPLCLEHVEASAVRRGPVGHISLQVHKLNDWNRFLGGLSRGERAGVLYFSVCVISHCDKGPRALSLINQLRFPGCLLIFPTFLLRGCWKAAIGLKREGMKSQRFAWGQTRMSVDAGICAS